MYFAGKLVNLIFLASVQLAVTENIIYKSFHMAVSKKIHTIFQYKWTLSMEAEILETTVLS